MTRNHLYKKRLKAFLYVGTTIVKNGFLTFAPKPAGGELLAQIAATFVDYFMCVQLYEIYNDKEINADEVIPMLMKAGFVVTAAGAITYLGIKICNGIINELINPLGPIAWVLQSIMVAISTLLLGWIWSSIIDKSYRQSSGLAFI